MLLKKKKRTGHGTTDWFQTGKRVHQGCILPPCLFNLYAEYIMRNAGLEEAQAGINIARRNINNLRNADDTTLMAQSKEELKSLLMKVKEESTKVGLKLNIQKTKIVACFPGGAEVKASACNVGDLGLIPGSGRSPREGNGNPLQYSCLENPMDRGAWWATVHGSQTVRCD